VRMLRGDETAALSTAAFLALSAMPKALGLSAHATQFVLLPALWGFWILLNAGVFNRFWFWVVDYAIRYGSQVGFVEGLDIAWSVGGSLAIPALFVLV